MKMKIGQGGTELERVTYDFNEMFGGNSAHPTWHWFIPLKVEFPDNMHKVVLGYEWDPTFGDKPYQEDDMVAAVIRGGGGGGDKLSSATVESFQDEDIETGIALSSTEAREVPTPESSTHGIMKKRAGKKKDDTVFVDKTKDIA
jgi:hypothetical protein